MNWRATLHLLMENPIKDEPIALQASALRTVIRIVVGVSCASVRLLIERVPRLNLQSNSVVLQPEFPVSIRIVQIYDLHRLVTSPALISFPKIHNHTRVSDTVFFRHGVNPGWHALEDKWDR